MRVRRSGLVSFVVKLGSLLTGLIFTVIVTTHLSTSEFGLWSLIGKTMGYTLLPTAVLWFWTTRYRARGIMLGKTIAVGSALFSVVLSFAFLAISIPVSYTIHGSVAGASNLLFFFLSAPQIALYTFAGSFEALLWATSPEKNSIGFASFELSKVIIGFYMIDVLKLSLEGTILTLIFAQAFQFLFTLFLTRKEFKDKFSATRLTNIVKSGWLAILNNLHNLIRSFDFLIVAAFTGSADLLAYFAAALVVSTVTGYSSYLGQGLYPSVLGGGDARNAMRQVLELQLLFLFPMILGGIFLRRQLLDLLKIDYGVATGILTILVIGSAFDSLQTQFESTISASDTIDRDTNVSLGSYKQSKLFGLAKINLSLATVYLSALAGIGIIYGSSILANPSSRTLQLNFGLVWAGIYAVVSFTALILKIHYSRKIAKFTFDLEFVRALVVGSAIFAALMYVFSTYYSFPTNNGEVVQALNIILVGIIGLGVYGAVVYSLSKNIRTLFKAIITSLLNLPKNLA